MMKSKTLFILAALLVLASGASAANVYKVVGQDSHGQPIYELDRVASSQAPAGQVATTTGPSVTVFNAAMFTRATAAVASETYAQGHALRVAAKEGGAEDVTPVITFLSGVVESVAGIFGAGSDE